MDLQKDDQFISKSKRPLKRSIFLFILAFITLLCLVLSILTYRSFNYSLYESYNKRMLDVLEYVYSHIDIENLSECVETGIESDKYTELVSFMDSIMEDFDIHYLYIIKPYLNGDDYGMMNVISADTAEGRKTDPDGYYLGFILKDVYELEELERYQHYLDLNKISYFKNFSTWGYDYTAMMPLINSKGEHFAALCVDIEVEDVERAIQTYTAANIVLIAFLGAMFFVLFLLWMNRNITEPIRKLEKSVVSFAQRSHYQLDPTLLIYEDPGIHTKNEVESLSDAVNQMSQDMRTYVKNVIDAEGKVEDMKSQVSHMDILAYQDALTHVKNKAWYDKTEIRVNEDISKGIARFGIIMIDLNNLKKINDNYGHEHGNDYIFGACHQICITYDHSPVFRIGGDEFVVLLENRDYENREKLLEELKVAFKLFMEDNSRQPWERYSAAIGMAIYDKNADSSMNDVFKRADKLMYEDKLQSKAARV
ncbi:diguanylate cyclase (GGDEF) domain-containing protein [Butyrivibrio proteoclasticus]|uniref:Diguanylate cyclase (GGDEF) domain-containing protein n=1 Tax=Butyrivibrio proteoclasticus TaxID=43305 RepID=A0A1I5QEV2_9FIRM|nr:diguanylate cyclase [Butyrivibrio proteoclasticus]SFP44778.1 diguanylate cyclase (GGDEF) domain-containing protein [Butyrivibrio proteoclasticus]